ncbi:hypothetical protein C8R46DRAFT_1032172 [Mycena filopes]|nr:hypothetical protein C8R46DRAFT_1032172 [Mycena filopes]
MYHSSPISSCLVSVVSCLSFILSSIHLGNTSDKDQLSAGSTPSRVSGTPTLTAISQVKPGLALTAFLVILSLGISAATASTWARSPGPGRLHRQPTPDPPPAADEDDEQDNIAGDDGEQDGDGGGEDDPQEDGGVDGGENGGADDGLATAAAPAPEDPPPPAGGIEEDEDRFRRAFVEDGGFSWGIVIFILGHGLLNAALRKWASSGTKANHRLPDVQKPTTIPGLLQRVPKANDLQCDALPHQARYVVASVRVYERLTLYPSAYYQAPIQLAFAFDPDIPTLVRQTANNASAFATKTVPTPAKFLQFFSWRVYLLLVGLPSLGFCIALLLLLGPLQAGAIVRREEELVPQADDDDNHPLPTPPTTPRRHRPPPAPHPSPISPLRLRPIAPLPYRDKATQDTCDKMVLFLKDRTAGRQQTRRHRDDAELGRERNERIRVVQRRVWGLIVELRREGAWADDEHEAEDENEHEDAAVGDEEEISA